MKSESTWPGTQVEPNLMPMSTASISGGMATARASALIAYRSSLWAASRALYSLPRTLPVRYLSRISHSSLAGLRKISPCSCNSCWMESAGRRSSLSIREKSTLPVSRREMTRASLTVSACSTTCAGFSTRCLKMAALRAEAGRAARPCLRATSRERPLSYSISRDSSRECSGSSRMRERFVCEFRWP